MPTSSHTEPIPRFVAERRIRDLGGLHAVAGRLGTSVRVAEALLLSERPLPEWVFDAVFHEPDGSPDHPGSGDDEGPPDEWSRAST